MGELDGAAVHGRTVFHDTRNAGRRLGVTSHPDEGVVVVSLWQGEVCTGTFRLPLADAPRLISVLADALAPPPADSALRRVK